MASRLRRLRLVADLYHFDQLVGLGWKWPLRLFTRMTLVVHLALVPIVLAVSLLLFRIVRQQLIGAGVSPVAIVVVALAVCFYVAAGQICRELFSQRRFVVADSPNADFFRALDVPAVDVFVVYVAKGMLRSYALVMIADLAFLSTFQPILGRVPLAALTLLCLPIALCFGTLAIAARCARRRFDGSSGRIWTAVGLAILSFLASYSVMRVVMVGRLADAIPTGLDGPAVSLVLALILSASVGGALGCAIALSRSLGILARQPFPIEGSPKMPAADRSFGSRVDRRAARIGALIWRQLPLTVVLHRELAASRSSWLIRRTYLVSAAATSIVLGAVAAGPTDRLLPGQAHLVTKVIACLTFLVCSATTQLVFLNCGPTRLRGQLRFAWENNASMHRVIGGIVLYYALPVFGLSAIFSLWSFALLGRLSMGLPLLGVGVMASALLAESLATSGPRSTDGSGEPGLVVGLLTLVLSMPLLGAAALDWTWIIVLAGVYGLALLAGGVTCTESRIRTLPLESAT